MNDQDKTPHPISTALDDILRLLRPVMDPEAGISIVDMGLIYAANRTADGGVHVQLATTSPACPMAELLVAEVEQCLRASFPPPAKIDIELTFTPPWNPSMMSQSAKDQFGWQL
jgi:metal-sulfur cluster biosynthetic enzyme